MVSYAITPKQRAEAANNMENAFIGRWIRNRQARVLERREQRQEGRVERIEARGRAGATRRAAGAGPLDTIMSGIGNIAGGIFGMNQEPQMPVEDFRGGPEPAPSNNTGIIIAVVAVVLVVVAIVVLKKKKG